MQESVSTYAEHRDVDALADIAGLPDISSILDVCARVTGMGYTVVAHVSDDRWVACAVLDLVDFGLPVGGELPVQSTLCSEVRANRRPVAFDHASSDPIWRSHHTPTTYGLESYIAVPIILDDGEVFGTLCSIDPKPAPASRAETVTMFELFAKLIATQIEANRRHRRAENALLDAQDTAVLRDQFIAVLGHDLRSPLAAIDAGVRLLKSRVGDNGQPILNEMTGSIRRAERLISDVLDFARGRLGGGLSVARRPATELPEILMQLVSELRVAHPERGVELVMDINVDIASDPDRIAQLASNLISNALTHGAAETPVRVTAISKDDHFEMTVINGGKPIPEELRARLFQPFNRRDAGEIRDGLGLGLYISNEIARAHGGALTVTSDEIETRFVFRMPVTAA
ncbi:GAF domain-containing sensor histidine kinase [Brevundimonas sp.]|uniref:GAF domain-containing sensor histidine kinase n=1 Tax=Brevundimonas sp. TaxID=1871086 RepID=UPI0028992BF8|nr:GAF domain-containing sensor histidine kinase [Brevundimonas sp.]